ncbi:MAG: TetR/AcrR family transcriptional regulator [Thermodesulfobacteriota bacterium]
MRKKENLETILEAALAVFAKFGYRKATLEDIAGRLRMTKSNLYIYAASKRELYQKTVAWALLRWQMRVREAVERESGAREKFTVMCFKAVEYLSEDEEFRQVLLQDPDIFPMFPVNDPFQEINRNSVLMIRGILQQGIREGVFRPVDPEKMSDVIFMIYKMFIIRTYVKTDERQLQEAFADTFELLVNGLFVRSNA